MATYSVNKVILLGNLTRDPELRYTSQGTAVCSFGLATNRSWTTSEGETREEVDFHNIVAWSKLAEICDQLLSKGRKVYVSGRIQYRDWTGDDGVKRYRTEIVIDEMIALGAPGETAAVPPSTGTEASGPDEDERSKESSEENRKKAEKKEDVNPDDIPF